MVRGFAIVLGLLLATLSAAAIILNLAAPITACRLNLCPETVRLQEAGRQMLRGTPEGLAVAIRLYREALDRNPASPYRWCDLGEALLVSGDVVRARYCFSQAYHFGPSIPPTLLHISSFYMREHEIKPALEAMARILSLVPDYDGLLFSYYDRMEVGVDEVLKYGVPADRRASHSYFRHLLTNASPEVAEKAWQWVGSKGLQTDTLAGDYVAFLLKNRRHEAAAETWAQYLGSRRRDYLRGNLLFNGGFESESSGCLLDWRVLEISGVRVSRDGKVAHSGDYSLRIDFLGKSNLNYYHVSELASVRPGRTRFRAFVRTAGLSTDQGVGFRIFDTDALARLDLRTQQAQGNADWKPIEATFLVPPEARLLTIQLCRLPSLKFDSNVAGTVWVDDAVLQPVSGR